MAQLAWKLVVQRWAERRMKAAAQAGLQPEQVRPLMLFSDECQFFLTREDVQFQTTARGSRTAAVYLTQNLPNVIKELGDPHQAHSLLGNLATKIFHCNDEKSTNEWAAQTIGQSLQQRRSFSSSGTSQWSAGASEQRDYDVPPNAFLEPAHRRPRERPVVRGHRLSQRCPLVQRPPLPHRHPPPNLISARTSRLFPCQKNPPHPHLARLVRQTFQGLAVLLLRLIRAMALLFPALLIACFRPYVGGYYVTWDFLAAAVLILLPPFSGWLLHGETLPAHFAAWCQGIVAVELRRIPVQPEPPLSPMESLRGAQHVRGRLAVGHRAHLVVGGHRVARALRGGRLARVGPRLGRRRQTAPLDGAGNQRRGPGSCSA